MNALKHKVVNIEGKEIGTIDLNPAVFATRVDESVIHEVVRWQLARRRQGTHSTLNRARMEGGGRKPFKQKGSGRARAGSRNSPIWVGGAVAHGPTPRDYDYRLPKRARRQALSAVLSNKLIQERIVILDEINIADGKTKSMLECLEKIGVKDGSATIVLNEKNESVERSSSNLKKVKTLPSYGANVYDLMNRTYLVSTKAGIEALQARLAEKKSE